MQNILVNAKQSKKHTDSVRNNYVCEMLLNYVPNDGIIRHRGKQENL